MITKHKITLAYTGAGGTLIHKIFLGLLAKDGRVEHINVVASESGHKILQIEWGVEDPASLIPEITGKNAHKVQVLDNSDLTSPIASGSYPVTAMIIAPCSVGTLSRIAQGAADDLITRSADIALKNGIPLILCVRETPLSLIHLRNMTLATEAGATVFPIIPTFYTGVSSIEELAKEYVDRVLGLPKLGLVQPDAYVWTGSHQQQGTKK